MKLSELADMIEGAISVHGDHEVLHSGDHRMLDSVGEESLFFAEDEKLYFI